MSKEADQFGGFIITPMPDHTFTIQEGHATLLMHPIDYDNYVERLKQQHGVD